jgi:hypothetical protein
MNNALHALGYFFLLLLAWLLGYRPGRHAPPDQAERERRRSLYARAVFISLALLLVLHRALVIFLAWNLDSVNSSANEAAGMLLVAIDPWGILISLGGYAAIKAVTGVSVWPENDLNTVYLVVPAVIDGLAVYLLWRMARPYFTRPARSGQAERNSAGGARPA